MTLFIILILAVIVLSVLGLLLGLAALSLEETEHDRATGDGRDED